MEKETGFKKVRFDPYTKNKHSMGYTDNNIILHTATYNLFVLQEKDDVLLAAFWRWLNF
jgi:hypothetical protein